MQPGPLGGMIFLLWFLFSIAAGVIILIAIWRVTKAHQSIAKSLKQIAKKE